MGKQETRKCKAYLQATNTSSSPCPCPKLARCDVGAPGALAAPETPIPYRSRHTGSGRAMAGGLPNPLTHQASSEQAQRKPGSLQTCPKGLAQRRKAAMAKSWWVPALPRPGLRPQPHLVPRPWKVPGQRLRAVSRRLSSANGLWHMAPQAHTSPAGLDHARDL